MNMSKSPGIKRQISPEEPELGFRFWPAEPPFNIGHPRLDIHVYSDPTERHFDPVWVRFPVAWSEHGCHHVIFIHPWKGARRYRVAAGRIILRDRFGKVIQAFSLGGILEIVPGETFTELSLTSTAPIFALFDAASIVEYLVVEFEVVMAIMRAAWPGDSRDLVIRLAEINPADLFRAGLLAVEERIRSLPHRTLRQRAGLQRVERTIRELRQARQWPLHVRSLADLLGQAGDAPEQFEHGVAASQETAPTAIRPSLGRLAASNPH